MGCSGLEKSNPIYSPKDFANVIQIIEQNEIQMVLDIKNNRGFGKKHLNIIFLP